MKKQLSFMLAIVALFSIALFFNACQKEVPIGETTATIVGATDRNNGNSKVFPPNAHPYGKSYDEWTILWFQEFMKFDCANQPWLHPENALFYQSGPVYFLAGLSTEGASANITVPHGKAILMPLINLLNDYPCPDPFFEPAPGQSMEDFLLQWPTEALATVTDLEVTIDGAQVSNLENYQFMTNLFRFTGNPDLANCFDPCITGEEQDAVAGGFWVMLKSLPVGEHTVHYHAVLGGWVQDGTFHITVE